MRDETDGHIANFYENHTNVVVLVPSFHLGVGCLVGSENHSYPTRLLITP
jgi:hypothetical protein